MQRLRNLPLALKLVLSLGVIITLAAMVVGILWAFKIPSSGSAKSTDTTAASKGSDLTAASVVEKFTAKAPEYLESVGYATANTSTVSTTIAYPISKSSSPYGLSVASSASVQYVRTDISQTDNVARAIAQYDSLLTGLGLQATTTNSDASLVVKLYAGSSVACQTTNRQHIGSLGATYALACANLSDITKAYADTDALLKKATNADSTTKDGATAIVAGIKTITSATISQDGKQLQTLVTKNGDGSSTSLYFYRTNDNWQYVGLRPTPSVDEDSSRNTPSALSAAIQNSPEREFLKQFIGGE